MNDRFKFRYWYKPLKMMLPMREKDYIWEFANNDNYIIMQCTGLKDKNGKLIYERDIVKFKPEVCVKPKQIVWAECHYQLKDTLIILCNMEVKQFGLEVIGNIYENKELLKCQK